MLRLDPNVALRLGIASASFTVASMKGDEEFQSRDDIDAIIAEEEEEAANDPLRKLLNTSTKISEED